MAFQDSDGEKSDDNLVVDVSNEVRSASVSNRPLKEIQIKVLLLFLLHGASCLPPPQDPASPRASPAHSPRENGLDKSRLLKKDPPLSPSSLASSSSTPSSKSKEISLVGSREDLSGATLTLLKGSVDGVYTY